MYFLRGVPTVSWSFSVDDYYELFHLKMWDGLADKYPRQNISFNWHHPKYFITQFIYNVLYMQI